MNLLLMRDEVSFPIDWRIVFSVLLALILGWLLLWVLGVVRSRQKP